jgi:hypothetical protein
MGPLLVSVTKDHSVSTNRNGYWKNLLSTAPLTNLARSDNLQKVGQTYYVLIIYYTIYRGNPGSIGKRESSLRFKSGVPELFSLESRGGCPRICFVYRSRVQFVVLVRKPVSRVLFELVFLFFVLYSGVGSTTSVVPAVQWRWKYRT